MTESLITAIHLLSGKLWKDTYLQRIFH